MTDALAYSFGERHIVVATPRARDEQRRRARLAQAERQLALAVDGQQRHLANAQPRQGRHQDQRLDPCGDLPRHGVAGAHALCEEPGRGAFAGVAVLREGHGAVVLVDEHDCVGSRGGARLDQCPQRWRGNRTLHEYVS